MLESRRASNMYMTSKGQKLKKWKLRREQLKRYIGGLEAYNPWKMEGRKEGEDETSTNPRASKKVERPPTPSSFHAFDKNIF